MNKPSSETLRRLYHSAADLLELSPWEDMGEAEFFCLQPSDGDLATVSVMGAAGEYHAIAFYRGEEARGTFFNIQFNAEAPADVTLLLRTPCLHISQVESSGLEKDERQLLTALGFKLSKKTLVPRLEMVRDGSLLIRLDADDAAWLEAILPQAQKIFQEILAGKNHTFDGRRFPLFKQSKTGKWRKNWIDLDDSYFAVTEEVEVGNSWESLSPEDVVWSVMKAITEPLLVGYRPSGTSVRTKSGGLAPIYLFMVMDSASGMVLIAEPFEAESNPQRVSRDLIEILLNIFVNNEAYPKELHTCEPHLEAALKSLCTESGIKCRRVAKLPALDEVYSSLGEALRKSTGG